MVAPLGKDHPEKFERQTAVSNPLVVQALDVPIAVSVNIAKTEFDRKSETSGKLLPPMYIDLTNEKFQGKDKAKEKGKKEEEEETLSPEEAIKLIASRTHCEISKKNDATMLTLPGGLNLFIEADDSIRVVGKNIVIDTERSSSTTTTMYNAMPESHGEYAIETVYGPGNPEHRLKMETNQAGETVTSFDPLLNHDDWSSVKTFASNDAQHRAMEIQYSVTDPQKRLFNILYNGADPEHRGSTTTYLDGRKVTKYDVAEKSTNPDPLKRQTLENRKRARFLNLPQAKE